MLVRLRPPRHTQQPKAAGRRETASAEAASHAADLADDGSAFAPEAEFARQGVPESDAWRMSRSETELTTMSSPQWAGGVRMLPAFAATPRIRMVSFTDEIFSRGA